MRIVVGTRGSALARQQTEQIVGLLHKAYDGLEIEIHHIRSLGDRVTDQPLSRIGDKGLFTRDLENALLSGDIDLAVHSLKDLPTTLPEGLTIGAVSQREDPRDALISRSGGSLDDLPVSASLGTSSLRRRAQLLRRRPDLHVVDLRGNVDTRLRKLDQGAYDAIVLAAAGLHRLGLQARITAYLDPAICLPAVSQGALGLEIRADDHRVRDLLSTVHDEATALETTAERAFLRVLEGGCQVPIAAHARYTPASGQLHLDGLIASLDGTLVLRDQLSGPANQGTQVGEDLAQRLLAVGAAAILAQARASTS